MKEHTIPCPFPLPADYKREFILAGEDFKDTITFNNNEIHITSTGESDSNRLGNTVLDWCAICVCEVRKELGV